MGWYTSCFFLCLLISLFFPSQFTHSSSSLSSFNSSLTQLCSRNDYISLLQFKNSLTISSFGSYLCDLHGGGRIPKTDFWKEGTDCCTWDGITCDKMTGHVISLDLSCSRINTTLHSNSSLFLLGYLQRLNLAYNHFNFSMSSTPSQIGRLTGLTDLNLSYSILGQIPSELSHLSKLVSLDLSFNYDIVIGKHQFESLVLNLTNLRELILNRVDLSLIDPYSLRNLSSSLTSLHLPNCGIHGKLPENVFRLPNLHELVLSDNLELNYYFPRVNWSSPLKILDLSSTKSPGKPWNSIGSLKDLTYLNLRDSNIYGSLPASLGNLTLITHLDLSQNRLSGVISSSLFMHLLTLMHIDLSNNEFQGPIPASILEQVNLFDLDLSSNNFSGKMNFAMFSKLKNLKNLDLSSNKLSIVTDNFINNLTLPKLSNLRLASCNLSEFPIFLKSRMERSLTTLDLSNNKIGGLIPKDMGLIMFLNLSHNLLEGFEQSPSGDPSFDMVFEVDLQSNRLQGSLPIRSKFMVLLSVANNKLSGVIPPSICNMTGLQLLDLSNNFFNGSIPPCLGSLSNTLTVLNLGRNRFHGPMPQTFEPECRLQAFDVSENQLERSIPRSLTHCKELEVLNLGTNNIIDTFPFWLDILPKLQVLVLKSNRFHGSILQPPKRTSAFSRLNIIDLSYNKFNGKLPSEFFERLNSMATITDSKSEIVYMRNVYYYGYYYDSVTLVNKGQEMMLERILTIFKAVDFSNNHFEGNIPKSVGNLKSLRGLNFSGNGFTGPIPSSFGNLSELESLDLSKNKLSGEIPTQLTGLTFLSHFEVSQNHLVGTIPRGSQFETFSNTSYEKNLGLCGPPLSKKCGNTEETPSPPSTSEKNQSSYKFGRNVYDWIVVVMGYVSGLVIGWVGGTFIFDQKKTWIINFLGMGRCRRGKRMNTNKRNIRGR